MMKGPCVYELGSWRKRKPLLRQSARWTRVSRLLAFVFCLTGFVLLNAGESFGQAAMPPGWKNPGWTGNPRPINPAPIRVPKPAPRPYRGYWTEFGYQWWGFGEGACGALHFLGDVGYGGIQCAGYGAGWLASLPGWVDDPAALVPPNPGSWQSGAMTGYDQRCKGGEGGAATCEMAVNCATLGVLPICQGLAEDLTTGSNNTMQCLGGEFAGAPAAAGIGAVVGIVRPLFPGRGGGRIPSPSKIDLMGGPASQLDGYFCYDLNYNPASGRPGMVGDVFKMPFESGSVGEIVCTNPHPGLGATGGTAWITDPLRVLSPGGRLIVNCAPKNPAGSLGNYMGRYLRDLERCGDIEIKRHGCLLKEFRCLEMYRTGENGIPGRMFTPQEANCVKSYEIIKLR